MARTGGVGDSGGDAGAAGIQQAEEPAAAVTRARPARRRAVRPPPDVHLQVSDAGVFIAPPLFKWIVALLAAGLLGKEAIQFVLTAAVEVLTLR